MYFFLQRNQYHPRSAALSIILPTEFVRWPLYTIYFYVLISSEMATSDPPTTKLFDINPVRTPEDLSDTIVLLKEYVKFVNLDAGYREIETELGQLPGKYSPPIGELLLARRHSDGFPIGCVAMRALPEKGYCEMKRLYVRPEARGAHVGKYLIDGITQAALDNGYEKMMLVTLPKMEKAIAAYEAQKFVRCEPYYESPLENSIYLCLDITIKPR
jgi:GNAT superfamily N-acetyltransferase